jgi:hypothetical protein
MAALWASYLQALAARPLLTKACTSSTLMSLGDTFTQFVIQKKKPEEFDPYRTARMVQCSIHLFCVDGIGSHAQAFYGLTTHGPLLHFWYKWLDSRIVVKSTTDVRASFLII